jgi:hypothetical protein
MNRVHRHLPVIKTMWPPQPGTHKLARHYGDALVCVRYRHDTTSKRRYTTIELVIDTAPIQRREPDRKVITVRSLHPKLHQKALTLGAKWAAQEQAWKMSLRIARALDILDETITAPTSP